MANCFGAAMVQLASTQGRKVYILGFNGRVTLLHKYEKKKAYIMTSYGSLGSHEWGVDKVRWVETPAANALHSVMSMQAGGGTCFGTAMTAALSLLSEAKDADLVMLSDAADRMPRRIVDQCNAMKARLGMRTSALFISHYRTKDLETQHSKWADTITGVSPDPATMLEGLTDMAAAAIK